MAYVSLFCALLVGNGLIITDLLVRLKTQWNSQCFILFQGQYCTKLLVWIFLWYLSPLLYKGFFMGKHEM